MQQPTNPRDLLDTNDHYIELQPMGQPSETIQPTVSIPKDTWWKKALKIAIFILIIFLPTILAKIFPSVQQFFTDVEDFISNLQPSATTSWIFWIIGLIMIVLAQPVGHLEMLIGYIYKEFWFPYFMVMTFKLLGASIIFYAVRDYLFERIEKMMIEYDSYHFFKYLSMRRPLKSLILFRFAFLPKALKNFGIPLFGYEFKMYIAVTFFADAFFSVSPLLLGMGAKSLFAIQEGSLFDFEGFTSYLAVGMLILSMIILFYLIYYTKNITKKILETQTMDDIKLKARDGLSSRGSLRSILGDP